MIQDEARCLLSLNGELWLLTFTSFLWVLGSTHYLNSPKIDNPKIPYGTVPQLGYRRKDNTIGPSNTGSKQESHTIQLYYSTKLQGYVAPNKQTEYGWYTDSYNYNPIYLHKYLQEKVN